MTRFVSMQTVGSVLVALVAWDAVMYAVLGTSPVMGFLAGSFDSSTQTV